MRFQWRPKYLKSQKQPSSQQTQAEPKLKAGRRGDFLHVPLRKRLEQEAAYSRRPTTSEGGGDWRGGPRFAFQAIFLFK